MLIRTLIAFALTCLVIGLGMPASAQSIPGVENDETVIDDAGGDGIREYHVTRDDVIFVRDRRSRWYRIAVSDGCITDPVPQNDTLSFRVGPDGRLDRLSSVRFGRTGRLCGVRSIRRSVAPPMVDSQSPIPAS